MKYETWKEQARVAIFAAFLAAEVTEYERINGPLSKIDAEGMKYCKRQAGQKTDLWESTTEP